MAAEMLEKILEVEKSASEKLKEAQQTASKLVEEAENESKKLLEQAKEKAREEALISVKKNTEYADFVLNEKRKEAEKAAHSMSEKADSKTRECVDTVVKMIIG